MNVRAFLGLELSPNLRQTLVSCQDAVRRESSAWRAEKWVEAENLHLTLKFLGPVPESAVPEIERAVARAVERQGEYQLALGPLSAVPRLRAASMIWAGLSEGAEETGYVAEALERRLSVIGHARSERPYNAHITLARARKPRTISFEALDAANRLIFAAGERQARMSVRGVTLYSSTLTPRGPIYREISFVPLQGD